MNTKINKKDNLVYVNRQIQQHIDTRIDGKYKILLMQIQNLIAYKEANNTPKALDLLLENGKFLSNYDDVNLLLKSIGIQAQNTGYYNVSNWNLYKKLVINNAIELLKFNHLL